MGFTAGYKVNEGTDYEFTVSDETISEVVLDTGISESDIAAYCYSALFDTRVAKIVATQHHTSFEPDWESIVRSNYYTYFSATSPLTSAVPTFNKDLLNSTDEVYQRNFLMWYGTIYPGTDRAKTGEFLVMDMKDIKKWYLNFDNAGFSTTPESVTSAVYDQVPLPEGYTWQGYTGNAYRYTSNTIAHASMGTVDAGANVDKNLYVINVINFNEQLAIGELNPSSHGQSDIGMEDVRYAGMSDEWLNRYGGYFNPGSPQRSYQGVTGNWGAVGDYRITPEYPAAPRGDLGSVSFVSWAELSNDEMLYQLTGNWGQQYDNCNMQGAQLSITKNLDIFLKWQSWCGLLFEFNGTRYKPIIRQGVVIGYSSDMSEESEWDIMTNVTGNNISPTPPIPPEDDNMESQELGATGSSGGFTKFFVMSPQDLSDFLTDFYSRAEPGETLSGNLVCSYILGVPSSNWASTDGIEITIHNSAQGTPFVSAAEYNQVTATNNYLTIGTIKVPRKTGTFYDFAPYSTYELFIPCCGWITLPDTVAGRTIRVSLQIDIATCGAKGIVKFDDGATCAVCSGVLGSSIPMQVIESGLLRGANVQAGSNALGGALMSGAGFGSGNAGLGLGGISQVVSSFTQSAIAGNTNYTNQKGSSGDITQFAMGHKCYLKITYPPVDEVVNDSMFGHTVGYLCEEVGQLSNFHGFTVCANPHVHINATSAERDEITQLLEQGVILPDGE